MFLMNSDRTRLSLAGGLVWQATDPGVNVVPPSVQDLAAGVIVVDLNVFEFKKTNLILRASFFPAISNPDRGRITSTQMRFTISRS